MGGFRASLRRVSSNRRRWWPRPRSRATVAILAAVAVWLGCSVLALFWLRQPLFAAILLLSPVILGAVIDIAICSVIEANLPPVPPLRERSLLVERATSLARFFWSTVMLVVGGFVGALVAIDLTELRRLPAQEGSGYLGSVLGYWLGAAVLVTLIIFTYGISVRVTIDLIRATRTGRAAALSRALRVRGVLGKGKPHTATLTAHLAHWIYPVLLIFSLTFLLSLVIAFSPASDLIRRVFGISDA